MKVGSYTNQPRESRLRDVRYVDWLRDGETITGVVVSFERVSGDAVEDIAFSVSAAVVGGNIVRYTTAGGATLSEYKITFLVTTTLQVREDEVMIWVEEV